MKKVSVSSAQARNFSRIPYQCAKRKGLRQGERFAIGLWRQASLPEVEGGILATRNRRGEF